MAKIEFNGVTNEVVQHIRGRNGAIVVPAGARVEVNDTALPCWIRHEGKVYWVGLDDMSAHEIMIDGAYIPGCGPQE
jgi:hypothetical protein